MLISRENEGEIFSVRIGEVYEGMNNSVTNRTLTPKKQILLRRDSERSKSGIDYNARVIQHMQCQYVRTPLLSMGTPEYEFSRAILSTAVLPHHFPG